MIMEIKDDLAKEEERHHIELYCLSNTALFVETGY